MAEIIVDTEQIFDSQVQRASDILMAEGKGLMSFYGVDVKVEGTTRFAVEVKLDADLEILLDAVKRAGLKVLEGAEKLEG